MIPKWGSVTIFLRSIESLYRTSENSGKKYPNNWCITAFSKNSVKTHDLGIDILLNLVKLHELSKNFDILDQKFDRN